MARIDGGLDLLHQRQLGAASPIRHHVRLQLADAVFSGKTTVIEADDLVHRVHDGVVLRQEPGGVGALGLFQVEVDVAVTHVAERHAVVGP